MFCFVCTSGKLFGLIFKFTGERACTGTGTDKCQVKVHVDGHENVHVKVHVNLHVEVLANGHVQVHVNVHVNVQL